MIDELLSGTGNHHEEVERQKILKQCAAMSTYTYIGRENLSAVANLTFNFEGDHIMLCYIALTSERIREGYAHSQFQEYSCCSISVAKKSIPWTVKILPEVQLKKIWF